MVNPTPTLVTTARERFETMSLHGDLILESAGHSLIVTASGKHLRCCSSSLRGVLSGLRKMRSAGRVAGFFCDARLSADILVGSHLVVQLQPPKSRFAKRRGWPRFRLRPIGLLRAGIGLR